MTVVYQGKYSHCMRIGVAVPLNSTVYRLRDAVSRETKIPMDQVLFPSLIRVCHSETILRAQCRYSQFSNRSEFCSKPLAVIGYRWEVVRNSNICS